MTRISITSRFVLLIATAAVLPLLIYGWVSVDSLRTGTRQSVRDGNLNVALRVAEQIELYLTNNIKVLRALGADLRGTRLEPWQQDRLVKNYVLEFPEFREITLFDAAGTTVATSRVGAPGVAVPEPGLAGAEGLSIAPITIDDDLLPTTTVAMRLSSPAAGEGWLVGEISLEELWRMVDRIRVGQEGFALLAGADGRLIAHGNPDEKRRIARGETLPAPALLERLRTADPDAEPFLEYLGTAGRTMLGVAAPLPDLGWTVVVEQPTDEAYALARQLERQLVVAIVLALLATVAAGWLWGRSFIRRIFVLIRGTRAIAAGRLDERIPTDGRDELDQLGAAFNSMADELVELQENVRRQERQAMFGRIAVGLVHDLSHPIQNIGNSCKLIVKMFDDMEYRGMFKETVDRELAQVKRVLEDLRHLARPIPLERFPLDVSRTLRDVVEAMRPLADSAGVDLALEAPEPAVIEGDAFALGRVCRNLIINAIQATPPGGSVAAGAARTGGRVQIQVRDTGCGIPADRLASIFDDFVTTKRRGLGLGLAISKKIVEQLGGSIAAASDLNKGTTITLDFPETSARPLATAVAG